MKKPVELWTFGDSKAEVTLAKILNEYQNKTLTNFAGRILNRVTNSVNNIQLVDKKGAKFLYDVFREHSYAVIDKYMAERVDPKYSELGSYLKNCVTIRLREWYNKTQHK